MADAPTILLVEDEVELLDITRLLLESLGYQVHTAKRPGEALAIMERVGADINLLLTDIIMPEMNGKELARQCLLIQPHLPVMYLSGYPADVIGHQGIIPEEVNFLAKPFTRDELSNAVESVLATIP